MTHKTCSVKPWSVSSEKYPVCRHQSVKTDIWIIYFALQLCLFLTLFFSEAVASEKQGGAPLTLVKTIIVKKQNINPPAEYIGHMEAIQTVELRTRVKGFLEQVNFKEGENVCSGDILYVIEQAPYTARVDADMAAVANAQAVFINAGSYLQRVNVVCPGGVPATDIDDAVTKELQAKAMLQEAKARLELSELDLKYTRIIAPIDGRIGRTAFTKGNLLEQNSGCLSKIVQLNPIRVVYSISENDIEMVQMALKDSLKNKNRKTQYILKPQIRLLSGKLLKTSGHIDFLDNTVDPGTGTIAVRAVFDNHDELLLPGQYVTVLIRQSNGRDLPVIPQAAVLQDHKGRYVLIVDKKNQVVLRRIISGAVIGMHMAVESGIEEGEQIIVEGLQKVRPGQIVKTTSKDKSARR